MADAMSVAMIGPPDGLGKREEGAGEDRFFDIGEPASIVDHSLAGLNVIQFAAGIRAPACAAESVADTGPVVDADGADLLVLVVHDIELHGYFLPFLGFSACATFSFFIVTALRMIP